jgi:hypothetical protein
MDALQPPLWPMVKTSAAERQAARRARRWAIATVFLLVLLGVLYVAALKLLRGQPVEYAGINEHFKYGSVGSDNLKGGIPYRLWKVLPAVFPKHLPKNGKAGYEAFGFIVERDGNDRPLADRPVGFSKRRIGTPWSGFGLDMVGLNCALCHAGTLRRSANREEKPVVIPGMPSHAADVERFFKFLFDTARDQDFTPETFLPAIEQTRKEELKTAYAPMGTVKRLAYRGVIHLARWEIAKLELKFCFIHGLKTEGCEKRLETAAGPGRIETWAPYKVLKLQAFPTLYDLVSDVTPLWLESQDLKIGSAHGFADASALWRLDRRIGKNLHWDGNTDVLSESAIVAAVGAGATPAALDLSGLNRVARWAIRLAPPRYEAMAPESFKTLDRDRITRGRAVYLAECASCHDPGRPRFGQIEPIGQVGTDRHRLDAFTAELAEKLNRVGTGYPWQLRRFQPSKGYVNLPLDGIWLRAPYLHNGSVPTLRELLKKPGDRMQKFCRGNDVYNWEDLGFVSAPAEGNNADPCSPYTAYDTTLPGNGNQGHLYGTDLQPKEQTDLLEYLKTL